MSKKKKKIEPGKGGLECGAAGKGLRNELGMLG